MNFGWAPCKAREMLAGEVAKKSLRPRARCSSRAAGSTREKKGAEEGKCKKLRVAVWPGNKEMQVVRACFPNEKVKLFLRPLEL